MEQVMNFVSLAWPFLVLVGIMYFFMYRPQQKLKVERGRFLMSLRKGDHVVTAGGIHGTIKVLRDKYVELEIAPKVIIKVEKTAIQHGDVKLIDEETAKKAGAAALGAASEEQVMNQTKHKDEPETEVVEEVVEVDDPKDAGRKWSRKSSRSKIKTLLKDKKRGKEMIETDTPSATRKKEIRQKMLALRRALSATDMEAMSLALADRICG